MILAAGLGTRMAPLSQQRAKPVLPVLDRPLLARHIDALARLGIERVVVNAHAHVDQLRGALAGAPIPVDLSLEPTLLGSGGGIRHAARWLAGPQPFLILNADMCVEFSLEPLLAAHARHGAALTLLLRDDPRKHAMGSIGYGIDGRVRRITDRTAKVTDERGSGLYTGIALLSGDIFARFPSREVFDLVPEVWVPMLSGGAVIASVLQEPEREWTPVGTPRELLDANLAALRALAPGRRVDASARVQGELSGSVWIGAGASVAAGAVVGPQAVVGAGAQIAAGCRVREALLLPAAKLAEGSQIARAIAFDSEVWRDA